MLDRQMEVAASSPRVLRYTLFKFVWACNALPSFLFITDSLRTVDMGNGTRTGGFSDVFPGKLDDDSEVAIKRLRIAPVSPSEHFVRVKYFLLPLRFRH